MEGEWRVNGGCMEGEIPCEDPLESLFGFFEGQFCEKGNPIAQLMICSRLRHHTRYGSRCQDCKGSLQKSIYRMHCLHQSATRCRVLCGGGGYRHPIIILTHAKEDVLDEIEF
jgi:hypothetical protein